MRLTLLIIGMFGLLKLQGQSEVEYLNQFPYSKYIDAAFDCAFQPKRKVQTAYNKPQTPYTNFLTSHFRSDSTYRITLDYLGTSGPTISEWTHSFKGRYSLDTEGNIVLLGEHPFTSNIISIKERKYRGYIQFSGYRFQLNKTYRTHQKRKLSTFCDGSCEMEYIQ